MNSLSHSQQSTEQELELNLVQADVRYQAPAIVYEGQISTRAGSQFGGLTSDDPDFLDPTNLFGE